MRTSIAAAALVAGLGASPASAFTTIYAFGDSLSDVGNVYATTALLPGGPYPISPPYDTGRFSNGPNWVDDLAADLSLPAMTASVNGGNDFAVGGAQTGPTPVNSGSPIDLDAQVGLFTALHFLQGSSSNSGALYTLDIGANDIMNALGKYTPSDAMDLAAFLNQAASNTVKAVDDLVKDGAKDLVYYEVPDLSVVPAFEKYGSEAGTLAKDFNEDVLAGIAPLESQGLTVFDVPIFNALDQIVAGRTKYDFKNVTTPCISGNFDTAGTACDNPNQYLFWDQEHPTAAAHALTADLAFDVIEGLPLAVGAPEPSTWALMLTGLAGLGLLSRRSSRGRMALAPARVRKRK
jgi:phospholipase/lecithinase/hemolysin